MQSVSTEHRAAITRGSIRNHQSEIRYFSEDPMPAPFNAIISGQFGAAIDMMERSIRACPDALWGDREQQPEFWYTAFHALFFLDYYLSGTMDGYLPPSPFTLDELNEEGLLPDRVYTKEELLSFLEHGRGTLRDVLARDVEAMLAERCAFEWLDLNVAELLLYNMRHVQHHAAQLNTLLRQHGVAAPRWVRKSPISR